MQERHQPSNGRRLLKRDERRTKLIQAAAAAFARQGFAGTSLDDVAHEAGVTKMIIYRHFDSKAALYRAVLDNARERVRAEIGSPDRYDDKTVSALIRAASDNPDGFRLLHRHARREPEFAFYPDELTRDAVDITEHALRDRIPDPARRRWIAALMPKLVIEIIMSWLDAGQPTTPDELAHTIRLTTRALNSMDTEPLLEQTTSAEGRLARAHGDEFSDGAGAQWAQSDG